MIHSKEEIEAFKKQGIHVIRRGDKEYPQRLGNLHQPPEVLYCKGDLSLLTRPAISIVGTRTCTRYGIDVAKRFAKKFAEAGIVVISGLADGIDTAAHLGAVEGSGGQQLNTIAVLGNGVNHCYPQANVKLQDKIAGHGLLVSEYLPNDTGNKYYFPMRNRIVAALSKALLIVEADLKSGTMITKDFALDLGIDVFAIPGPVTSLQSRGTNALIKEAACSCAVEPDDVLATFGVTVKSQVAKNTLVQISFDEKRILDIIGREAVHIDEILERSAMPIPKLAVLLTSMELKGLLRKLSGNVYSCQEC
ncbi:MAG: DNA-processing protein DprA [Christensenellaceae bacterium]|jgi:DNA processing protein|nr:DNA-processing protein DprA [Christensenellaceae bacterium]